MQLSIHVHDFLSSHISGIRNPERLLPLVKESREIENIEVSARLFLACESLHCGYSIWKLKMLIEDFVQSFGCILGSHWLRINAIHPGAYCNFQAVALTAGELGSALWTLVVAVSTFLAIAGGPNMREWVVKKSSSGKGRWVLTLGIWGFIFLISVNGLLFIQPFHPEKGPYCITLFRFAVTLVDHIGVGWCWIDQQFFWERIFSFYCI
jgi:hypothetical protein